MNIISICIDYIGVFYDDSQMKRQKDYGLPEDTFWHIFLQLSRTRPVVVFSQAPDSFQGESHTFFNKSRDKKYSSSSSQVSSSGGKLQVEGTWSVNRNKKKITSKYMNFFQLIS